MARSVRLLLLGLIAVLVAACQSAADAPAVPTAIPFPTTTPGQTILGLLPTLPPVDSDFANPATVVALAGQPTATPNRVACPPRQTDVTLAARPDAEIPLLDALLAYLNAGGDPVELGVALREDWDVLDEDGYERTDIDLTGEGAPEIVLSLAVPDLGGLLVVLGCEDGRYLTRYTFSTSEPEPPQVILVEDANVNQRPELSFAVPTCDDDDPSLCGYRLHVIGWQPELGRFASLLGTAVTSDALPQFQDIDGDRVLEIVTRMASTGTFVTGPLRTGVDIYDWDGSLYVLSIVQPDPLRFRIQVIHEAERHFVRREMEQAASLYRIAIDSEELRTWHNAETPILRAFALYRKLLAQTELQGLGAFSAFEEVMAAYPESNEEIPVYALLARVFWETFQQTSDMSAACVVVEQTIAAREDALELINRYGTRSPSYTPRDLCPF
ncbi:MAG: hypothetical protein ACOCZH_05295 [Phototrophicaceae bacterium]